MAFIMSALSSCSWLTYGGPIFNVSVDSVESLDELNHLSNPNGLIVLATRPPLDDPQNKIQVESSDRGERKKPIPRTGSAI